VSGSYDETVRLWDAVTGAALQTLKGHSNRVYSMAFSPDGKQVVLGSYDETVRLWDAVIGAALQTLKGHSHFVISVAFSPDGKQVVSGSYDETVRLWDAVTGAALYSKATQTTLSPWLSHLTASRSCQGRVIIKCGSGTLSRERRYRRSRPTRALSTLWSSRPTAG